MTTRREFLSRLGISAGALAFPGLAWAGWSRRRCRPAHSTCCPQPVCDPCRTTTGCGGGPYDYGCPYQFYARINNVYYYIAWGTCSAGCDSNVNVGTIKSVATLCYPPPAACPDPATHDCIPLGGGGSGVPFSPYHAEPSLVSPEIACSFTPAQTWNAFGNGNEVGPYYLGKDGSRDLADVGLPNYIPDAFPGGSDLYDPRLPPINEGNYRYRDSLGNYRFAKLFTLWARVAPSPTPRGLHVGQELEREPSSFRDTQLDSHPAGHRFAHRVRLGGRYHHVQLKRQDPGP
jgi:hypothetical protein